MRETIIVVMTATQQRDLAGRVAGTDPTRALALARGIEDPWFACQALAWVARYAPEDQVQGIIRESLMVSRKSPDPYRIVAAAAWPVRAVVERGHTRMLASIIPELLVLAKEIKLLVSRSEALFLLFQAVFPAGQKIWLPVLESLREASTPLIGWRQRRNLTEAVLIIWSEDQNLAAELISDLSDLKLKKKIERTIATGERRLPRPFFWTTGS